MAKDRTGFFEPPLLQEASKGRDGLAELQRPVRELGDEEEGGGDDGCPLVESAALEPEQGRVAATEGEQRPRDRHRQAQGEPAGEQDAGPGAGTDCATNGPRAGGVRAAEFQVVSDWGVWPPGGTRPGRPEATGTWIGASLTAVVAATRPAIE